MPANVLIPKGLTRSIRGRVVSQDRESPREPTRSIRGLAVFQDRESPREPTRSIRGTVKLQSHRMRVSVMQLLGVQMPFTPPHLEAQGWLRGRAGRARSTRAIGARLDRFRGRVGRARSIRAIGARLDRFRGRVGRARSIHVRANRRLNSSAKSTNFLLVRSLDGCLCRP